MAENESRDTTNDTYTLGIEADEVVREVAFAVSHVEISSKLPKESEKVYLNVRTKENDVYCVELSLQGFRIVGKAFDEINEDLQMKYYETIYALLDQVSPKYRNTFGDTLLMKLQGLQQRQDDDGGPS